jgi:hypothetical protein
MATEPRCFFADWDVGPCDGQLVRAHLVKRQALRRAGHAEAITDPRSFVWCCGGPQGNGGHHGKLDSGQLRVGIERLPLGFVELMRELSMTHYIVKFYGRPRSARLERIG